MIYGSSDINGVIDRLGSCLSASEFLNLYVEIKAQKDNKFSIRKFSTHLGYHTPSFVSDVLRGKRKFNFNLFQRLTQAENFSEMERQFLLNVLLAESATTEDKDSYYKANQAIIDVWMNRFVYHHNASPIDKIIIEYVQGQGWVNWGELVEVFKDYFPEPVVYDRLRFLTQNSRNLKREGDQLCVDTIQNGKRFILPRNSYQDLLPLLKNTLVEQKAEKNSVSLFNSYLTDKEFEEAISTIYSCIEKLILLSIKSDKDSQGKPRSLRTLFINYMTLAPTAQKATDFKSPERSQSLV